MQSKTVEAHLCYLLPLEIVEDGIPQVVETVEAHLCYLLPLEIVKDGIPQVVEDNRG